MKIKAFVHNQHNQFQAKVTTNDESTALTLPPKSSGFGSSVNGGELLFLALATCYCNDLYREAGKQGIPVQTVEVTVEGDFGGPGEPARNVVYRAHVTANAPEEVIRALMQHTDQVAEIQNTLREATPITLAQIEAISA